MASREIDLVSLDGFAYVAGRDTEKKVSEPKSIAVSADRLMRGDVFLALAGEERALALVYGSIDGDRCGGDALLVIYENGARRTIAHGGRSEVFKLGHIEPDPNSKNPLRTLLNWAADYGG